MDDLNFIYNYIKMTKIKNLKNEKIIDYLKKYFNVPENWDKHDYELHRYSFNDIVDALEDYESD